MAISTQTKEHQVSLKELSRRMGENFDQLSESLTRASRACKAFAVDYEAAFPKADSDSEAHRMVDNGNF